MLLIRKRTKRERIIFKLGVDCTPNMSYKKTTNGENNMNGWNHLSANGMATNADPIFGGIIDSVAMSMKLKGKEEWFIVFNHPDLDVIDGLSSKAEAFEIFEKTMAGIE